MGKHNQAQSSQNTATKQENNSIPEAPSSRTRLSVVPTLANQVSAEVAAIKQAEETLAARKATLAALVSLIQPEAALEAFEPSKGNSKPKASKAATGQTMQERVLAAILGGAKGNGEVREALGLDNTKSNTSAISQALSKLVQGGKLVRRGEKPFCTYTVK